MGEEWPPGSGIEDDSDDPELESGLVFSGEMVWLGGIHLTPYSCPDCLKYDVFDCDACTFYIPEDCRLLADPDFRKEIRVLFDITRERNIAYARRQRELRRAVYLELKAHGRPLHYSVIAHMIDTRYPSLKASERSVLKTLANNSHLFEHVDAGVYKHRTRGADVQ